MSQQHAVIALQRRRTERKPVAKAAGAIALVLAAAALCGGTAFAQDRAGAADLVPQNVVSLQAEATVEVQRDLLSLTFAATREGTDANAVQSALKEALDAALAQARAIKSDGQVDIRTGNFSLTPRQDSKTGTITGWNGRAELVVEGRDMAAISALTGRITTMTVSRVSTGISRELRDKVEGEATAAAIANYRAKASVIAQQFGFTGYTIREVNVNVNSVSPMAAPPMMYARAKTEADAALPVEAGKGTVVGMVNGTVVMTR